MFLSIYVRFCRNLHKMDCFYTVILVLKSGVWKKSYFLGSAHPVTYMTFYPTQYGGLGYRSRPGQIPGSLSNWAKFANHISKIGVFLESVL